jgi:hypothetical protein
MSLLDEWEQIHAEMVATAEKFGRLLELARSKKAAAAVGAPVQIEYDRERLPAPPVPVQPTRTEEPGEFLDLDVESLHVTHDGEKKTFKVKGGAYRKWGVFIWPEVLQGTFGLDPDALQPGLYGFKHKVRILMDGKNPKKVIGLAQ